MTTKSPGLQEMRQPIDALRLGDKSAHLALTQSSTSTARSATWATSCSASACGAGMWTGSSRQYTTPDYWKMGVTGAMFQMIAHGISSAGMFFMVGVLYDRVHHRDLNQFGGLFAKMPVYSGLAIGDLFRRLGAAGIVRIHRRSVRRAVGVEVQPGAGDHLRGRRDPDGRLHPVGDPAACTWAPSTRARIPRHLTPITIARAVDRRRRCWCLRSCSACIRKACWTTCSPRSTSRSSNWPRGPRKPDAANREALRHARRRRRRADGGRRRLN